MYKLTNEKMNDEIPCVAPQWFEMNLKNALLLLALSSIWAILFGTGSTLVRISANEAQINEPNRTCEIYCNTITLLFRLTIKFFKHG